MLLNPSRGERLCRVRGREREFYRLVFSSSEPEHVQWRSLVPHFYGVQTVTAEDGEMDQMS